MQFQFFFYENFNNGFLARKKQKLLTFIYIFRFSLLLKCCQAFAMRNAHFARYNDNARYLYWRNQISQTNAAYVNRAICI